MTMPNKVASRTSAVKWVLLVSVIVNLFLGGALAGGIPGMHSHKHFALMALATPHSKQMIKRMTHDLGPTDATAFHEVIEPQDAALKQAREQVYESIKAVAAIYEQDPPDPEALRTAIDHLSQSRAALGDVVGTILEDSYTKLSPDGRHRLAELK